MKNRAPVWRALPQSKFDLGTSLRRHNRMLSFVGALIVFLTFVIKDGLREHLRSLADALGFAQNIFRLRNENAVMLGLLERIVVAEGAERKGAQGASDSCKGRSGIFYGYPQGPNPYGIQAAAYGMGMNAVLGSNLLAAAGMDGKAEVAKFYVNADQLLMVDAVLDDMKSFVQDLHDQPQTSDVLDRFLKKSAKYREDYAKSTDACRTEPNETDKLTSELSSDVQIYASRMLANAELLKFRAERRYKACTWASYILYTLGWGLGLIGKLYSGAGLDAEE